MVFIRIDGKSVTSVLSAFRETGVMNITERAEGVEIGIARKELQKAIAICDERCYNYTIIGTSFSVTVRKLLSVLPAIIASLIMAVVVFGSNAFVWRVEIAGVEGAAALKISNMLDDMGVRAGALINRLDRHEIERLLTESGDISAASVTKSGSVLKVDVLMSDFYDEHAVYGDAVVSGYDCVITKVVANCGTPVVKAGDVVRRGDVLIEGKEYATADGSELGIVAAAGRAYGRVTFTFSVPIAESGGLRHTGRSETVTALKLFGLTIGGTESSYQFCESVTERKRLSPLPVEVVRVCYHELDVSSFDEEAEAFIREKADELESTYGVSFDIRTDIAERNGINVMTVYFTAEICVGGI